MQSPLVSSGIKIKYIKQIIKSKPPAFLFQEHFARTAFFVPAMLAVCQAGGVSCPPGVTQPFHRSRGCDHYCD